MVFCIFSDHKVRLVNRGMKAGYVNGLRSKQLSLPLIIFCTALLIWRWERTSHQLTFHPPHELENFPQATRLRFVHQDPAVEDDFPHDETVSSQVSEKDGHDSDRCNYARGEWVADKRRPLYSGFGCKQWLSGPWSCRLTQRTDFSYENFKWKPEGCELPEFEGHQFLSRMKDKAIAFVGDSLGRQQFQSLMCMVTGGEERPEVEDVGGQYGFTADPDAVRPSGWAYRFPNTNTTILFYWSATLCDLEPLNVSNPTTSYAMHLDRPAAFLKENLHRFDVLILNTGHHWNRGKLKANRWEMYVNGVPNTDRKLAPIGNAKKFAIHSVVRWLDSQLPQHPHLTAFLRSLSPRHFSNGEWNSGGSCDSTIPLAGGSVVPQNASGDPVAKSATRGTRVKLLDITPLSQLRDEGHISKYSIGGRGGFQDCLHWCLPGIPDTWNEILAAQLTQLQQ